MEREFRRIASFLDWHGQEATGRAIETLGPEMRVQLKALAGGTLTAEERAELAEWLREHPEWVAELAHEVQALRVEGRETNSSS